MKAFYCKSMTVLLITGSLFISLISMANISQADSMNRHAAMKYRSTFMHAKGKHSQAIKLLVKNRSNYTHIVTHAEILSLMADDMLDLFPANSRGGRSRALPEIWNKDGSLSKEFIHQAEIMKEESNEMVLIAKKGNYKAINKQLKKLANNGCRSCHQQFRGDKK